MTAFSIVRDNAEKDPTYCPYCMRCTGLVRMVKVEPFYWRCACGAEHDERRPEAKMTQIKVGDDTVTLHVNEKPDIQVSAVDEDGAPYARLSVRLEEQPATGCFWLKDWSENAPIAATLIEKGLVVLTGRTQQTGYAVAKEARLNLK